MSLTTLHTSFTLLHSSVMWVKHSASFLCDFWEERQADFLFFFPTPFLSIFQLFKGTERCISKSTLCDNLKNRVLGGKLIQKELSSFWSFTKVECCITLVQTRVLYIKIQRPLYLYPFGTPFCYLLLSLLIPNDCFYCWRVTIYQLYIRMGLHEKTLGFQHLVKTIYIFFLIFPIFSFFRNSLCIMLHVDLMRNIPWTNKNQKYI